MDLLDRDAFDLAGRLLDAYPEPVGFTDFGPYHLREAIGRGGMGEVFLAEDRTTGRLVAIKFLRYAWPYSDLPERFVQEIKTLAKLEHPYIARLYEGGIHPNGTPYFAMEFVDGEPMDGYCRTQQCSLEARLRLFRSVCEAVQYAHTRLILHRDLKPSNILVRPDGTPKLVDFGIAKELENPDQAADQTQTELRFTRAYAAPEQLRGEPVGVYSDVYALGVILYQLLAGKLPNDLPSEAGEAERPSASSTRIEAGRAAWNDLDVLALKAIRKDIPRRYHSVVELSQDIDRYLNGEPLMARRDTFRYRIGKYVKRNRRTVIAGALVFVIVTGLVGLFTWRLKKERDYANRETAIATAMNRFLSNDLLGRSDPFRSGKSQESFADVVNRASLRIDAQFASEPLVAARLHETIGRAFDNRSDFVRARQEYKRANELFERAEGSLSENAILVRLRLAAMEAASYEPGSLAVAQTLMHDAEGAIEELGGAKGEIAVWLPYARGAVSITKADAQSANQQFSEALSAARANPSLDPVTRLRMMHMVAVSYIRLDRGAKAEPLLREVMAAFSKAFGAHSPEVLRVRAYLAQALMRQRRYEEAIQETNRIYPELVAKLGEEHQASMAVLGTRAASEGYLVRLNDAIRDDLALHDIAVRKHVPFSQLALGSLSDAALSQCRAGRYAEGEVNARQAFSEAGQAFGPKSPLTSGCAYSLAVCLIGRDKLGEASELLRNIDVVRVAQLSGDSAVGPSVALQQGRIAAKQGDYVAAARYAQIATPGFGGPDADVVDKRSLEELEAVIRARGMR